MTVDTRPEMTRAQFDEAAAYIDEGHWLTGEDRFLHVPAVMLVEGWNSYGRPGHDGLTESQRVLMMWSDLVGQVANGGFIQFIDNYENVLEPAYVLIGKLDWPELTERFDLAFREQAGDPARPCIKRARVTPMSGEWVLNWPTKRGRIIAHLARKRAGWRRWARPKEEAACAALSDKILHAFYNQAVEDGEIVAPEERDLSFEEEPAPAADAFDAWFYLDATKAASQRFVGDYIRRHRDDLCRLID